MATAAVAGFVEAAESIVAVARALHARGWLWATSGNLSVRVGADAIAITVSGRDKGRLSRDDVMLVDGGGRPIAPAGARPSAEAALHVQLYRRAGVGAVVHAHSPAATVLSRLALATGEVRLRGWEMEKALAGVATHEHEERVPVVGNSQDVAAIARAVESRLEGAHGYLIAGHGLYAWGAGADEAVRHAEALEFLCDCELRLRAATIARER